MKTTEISVYCWHCGKRFTIEIANVVSGKLFCCNECRIENLEKELIELEKVRKGGE